MTTASTTAASTSFDALARLLREAATVGSIGNLCSWDQETRMPPKAAAFRAEQLSYLSRLAHEKRTSPRVGELLEACEQDASLTGDPGIAADLREIRRDYDRATKLPGDLVAELADTSSRAMEAWKDARARSDFKAFEPWLVKTVELNRRKAERYGAPEGGELYDALVEDFEPEMRSAEIESIFAPLRESLTPLIAEIAAAPRRPSRAPDEVTLDLERQKAFNREVAEHVGFDFASGALEVSTHPFSEGVAPDDTRMTTRYFGDRFTDALSATLHEAGHSLYEQGLPKQQHFGLPRAEAVSLGVHESQSRLWENQVGRSRAFWEWLTPLVKDRFKGDLDRFGVNDYFGCVNVIEPSFIRVEADEATYHLHIMLRFDIERALLRGEISVADVPAWWNERIKKDLGLDVPDDARGCLQDIHWSMGAIGYFPTYTLGSLMAAQMWEAITRDDPGMEEKVRRGEFADLLSWLRERVHAHGRRYTAKELCERVTGAPLGHGALMKYLEAKLPPLYGI